MEASQEQSFNCLALCYIPSQKSPGREPALKTYMNEFSHSTNVCRKHLICAGPSTEDNPIWGAWLFPQI